MRSLGDVVYLEVQEKPFLCNKIGGALSTIDLQLSLGLQSTDGLKFVVLNPIVTESADEIPSAKPVNPPVVTTKPARPSNNGGSGFIFFGS